jgi:hypothetical protein
MSNGYSWTNTSQWSQIPTAPADQQNPQQQTQQVQTPAPQQSQPQNNQNYNPAPASQEPRRDMITRLYKQILGREPDTAGLNYYLFNTNITEAQISKEMYESTEHQSIVNRSKDVREMITKLEDYNRENSELKTKLQNAESLNANYKILLDQKTQIINSMKSSGGTVQSYSQQQQEPKQQPQQNPFQNNDQQGLILEDPFSDEPKKGKGCIGWVKSLFSFS